MILCFLISFFKTFFRLPYSALSGESGIRTRDTLLAYTRFPGVPLQPLEHLSKRGTSRKRAQITKNISIPLNLGCKFTELINYKLLQDKNILKFITSIIINYLRFSPNIFNAFRVVNSATSVSFRLHISDILFNMNLKYDDSLRFPLKGIGERYGESVSSTKRSLGQYFKVSLIPEFLKVTTPLTPIIKFFNFKISLSSSTDPPKL